VAGQCDHCVHVDAVDVGPFLAIDLDVDEALVHQRRGAGIFERLVRHHVAPVAGGVADREQDRLVLLPRPRERLLAPRVPLDRVLRVLQQVRRGLVGQPVHALYGSAVALPGGTVTFLFTDIEGSTRLLQELGDGYGQVVADHRRLLRDVFQAGGGSEVDTQGDAFFYSFPRARDAVRAAVDGQRALATHAWPGGAEVLVRMGLHTGEPTVGEEGYLGLDVVRAARICSAGHGGQILLSETTRALLGNDLPERVSVRDLGQAHLKDIQHEHVYELALDESSRSFPPLKAEDPEDTFEKRFDDRINRYVEEQLEAALSGSPTTQVRHAAGGLITLVLVVAAIVAIVLLVKLVL
jgi:class 3 adenylate cyclase